MFVTDTFTVRASTVLLDSVQTSGGSLLIGRYTDPTLGVVEARSFFQVAPFLGDTLKADPKAVYDSLVLALGYNGYAYGDTTRYQNILVHRLTDTLNNSKVYLNASQVPYEAAALGQARYKLSQDPNQVAELRVKLSDAFGRELFGLAGKPQSTDAAAFRNYVKGLAILPGAGNEGSVLGFSQAYVYVYYHVDTLVKHYDLVMALNSTVPRGRFARITSQRSGPLASLTKPGQALPTSASNGETYLHNGVGLVTKLEFPSLLNLRNLPQGKVAINRAELILEPKPAPTNLANPQSLFLLETDDSNGLRKTPQGYAEFAAAEGAPASVNGTTFLNDQYQFILSSQIQQMLTGQRKATGLLVLRQFVPLSSTTQIPVRALGNDVSRAVFDAKKIKLRVYYTVSNN